MREEDTRPRMFWFEWEDGTETGEVFNMGAIKKQIRMAEKFGFTIMNKDEFKEYM